MARTSQTARKVGVRTVASYRAPPVQKATAPKVVNLIDLDYTLDPTCMTIMDIKEKLQRAIVHAAKGDSGIDKRDMPDCDELFKQLALQPMTPRYLHYTKIGKVMKQIRDMDSDEIPSETEYSFKERAGRFVESWKNLRGVQVMPVDA